MASILGRKMDSGIARQGSTFQVVSLFSGCGGLDLGFRGGFTFKGDFYPPQGFDIVGAYDRDPRCVETYRSNLGDIVQVRDLETTDGELIPYAPVVIGGFPCQDFSSCGPKSGLQSERGRLYKVFMRYMNARKPTVVVAENVPHLARMRHGEVLSTILADFQSVGYRFKVWSLFGPDFGVPQRRRRLFMIGVADTLCGFPTEPQPIFPFYRTIDWAIGDLVGVSDESVPNQSQFFAANRARNGNGQGDERNRAGEPAYTIRANPKSRIQFHYSLDRRLTIRECARLQTFPDTFAFPHSTTVNLSQIGNAVPPVLAFHVARSVHDFLASAQTAGLEVAGDADSSRGGKDGGR